MKAKEKCGVGGAGRGAEERRMVQFGGRRSDLPLWVVVCSWTGFVGRASSCSSSVTRMVIKVVIYELAGRGGGTTHGLTRTVYSKVVGPERR